VWWQSRSKPSRGHRSPLVCPLTFDARSRACFEEPVFSLGRALGKLLLVVAGVIQLVECQLPKLDVAGSSPVARSLEVVKFKKLEAADHRAVTAAFFLVPWLSEASSAITLCAARRSAVGSTYASTGALRFFAGASLRMDR
jgi:hypothetical protein